MLEFLDKTSILSNNFWPNIFQFQKEKKWSEDPLGWMILCMGRMGNIFEFPRHFPHISTQIFIFTIAEKRRPGTYIFLAFQFKNLININYLLGTAPASLAVSQSINDLKCRFWKKICPYASLMMLFSMVRGPMNIMYRRESDVNRIWHLK